MFVHSPSKLDLIQTHCHAAFIVVVIKHAQFLPLCALDQPQRMHRRLHSLSNLTNINRAKFHIVGTRRFRQRGDETAECLQLCFQLARGIQFLLHSPFKVLVPFRVDFGGHTVERLFAFGITQIVVEDAHIAVVGHHLVSTLHGRRFIHILKQIGFRHSAVAHSRRYLLLCQLGIDDDLSFGSQRLQRLVGIVHLRQSTASRLSSLFLPAD
mmetsp:Transcript_29558/g.47007  ORF Transcript_29558/g.47007 Transcript_29558/m.47007 type:complete len:211 (-) Transcript_29558:219-851(-)